MIITRSDNHETIIVFTEWLKFTDNGVFIPEDFNLQGYRYIGTEWAISKISYMTKTQLDFYPTELRYISAIQMEMPIHPSHFDSDTPYDGPITDSGRKLGTYGLYAFVTPEEMRIPGGYRDGFHA